MQLKDPREMLGKGGVTCLLVGEKEILSSTLRGIKPIINWIEEGRDLRGFKAFDTVVGRAAALLYALAGVSYVYGHVMSLGACRVLDAAGIEREALSTPEMIVNRPGTGMCPMEAAVKGIEDPMEAFSALKTQISALQSSAAKI